MPDNNYKALFFDIDGTLVSFQTHEIPPSTVEALQQAKRNGLKIFIATGRPVSIINNLDAIKPLIDGFITTNGAYCFVGEEVIYHNPIPDTDVRTWIELSDTHQFPCIFVGEKGLIVHHPDQQVKAIFQDFLHVPRLPTGDPRQMMEQQAIVQITPFITEGQEKEFMALVPGCISGRWHPAFSDVTAIGSDKGNGIRQIARHFGFGLDETMAFGDGGNDISMIQTAGMGIAMGNANDSLKAVADYITSDVDEHGIEAALRHWHII